jgi:hypothetical protein
LSFKVPTQQQLTGLEWGEDTDESDESEESDNEDFMGPMARYVLYLLLLVLLAHLHYHVYRKKEGFVVKSTYLAEEANFKGAGKLPGIQIWRIEQMQPVPLPKEQYGQFANEDSYIVLKSEDKADGSNLYHLHYWLGKNTQQDKSTMAAIRAVQLSEYLQGQIMHHREVQEHESELFLSHFDYKVQYLEGGVPSAIRRVEKGHYEPRLIHIKNASVEGTRNQLRCCVVDTHVDSMNKQDSFVLDAGTKIMIWNGPHASRVKKNKSLEIAIKLNNENNGGKGKVLVIDSIR